MVTTLYTIGYAGFSITDFINTLKEHDVSAVIDVRSQPYSQRFADYNKDILQGTLKNHSMRYKNYSLEFGARQDDHKYYTNTGYLDFDLFSKSPAFMNGMSKLTTAMEGSYTFALMCAEKDPFNCHRSILVARAFHNAGYNVIHLLPNGRTLTQNDIEKRLLDKYFPKRDQLTMFDDCFSTSELITQAYMKRNAEIGYSISTEEVEK